MEILQFDYTILIGELIFCVRAKNEGVAFASRIDMLARDVFPVRLNCNFLRCGGLEVNDDIDCVFSFVLHLIHFALIERLIIDD